MCNLSDRILAKKGEESLSDRKCDFILELTSQGNEFIKRREIKLLEVDLHFYYRFLLFIK